MTPEELARLFHETYERLAPEYGYKTREKTAVPWFAVPKQNKDLMTAVAGEVLDKIRPDDVKQLRDLLHRVIPTNWRERERRTYLRQAYEEAEQVLGCRGGGGRR